MPTGTVSYQIVEKYFDCGTVRELIDCTSGAIYYVDDLLLSGGTPIQTGTTFVGNFNFSAGTTGLTAVTYVRELQGSSTITFNYIVSQLVNCNSYSATPTPTPTTTITPTVTPTPTPTPSSSLPANILYVYSACTGTNSVVVQTQPVSGVTVTGMTINYSGTCWSYVGAFTSPYSSPSGFIRTDYSGNYFGIPSTIYNSCASCVSVPTPLPSYRAWNVLWSWAVDCGPCQLTGGGTAITLYTPYSATTLSDGVIMYTDVYLTNPFPDNRWFSRNNKIYYNDGINGISFFCNVGGGC
jgi:hypothetical protein